MPIVVMLSGPNGAGKTTTSRTLLQGPLSVDAFVNADIIAQGLGMPDAEVTAARAGRIMIERLEELEEAGASFAFETTLASKTFVPRISRLKSKGYVYALLYLWLRSSDDAIRRVRDRVRRGGHHVPDEAVRRRYDRGLNNFFRLYRPLADVWRFYDNSDVSGPRLLATGVREVERIEDKAVWARIIGQVDGDARKSN